MGHPLNLREYDVVSYGNHWKIHRHTRTPYRQATARHRRTGEYAVIYVRDPWDGAA